MAPRTLDLKEIPQFNEVRVVAEYVAAAAKGESYELASRQVKYCQQAARILGCLDTDGGVTPRGVKLSVTPSNGLLPVLREALEASRVGQAWMTCQKVSSIDDLEPESVVPFLTSCAGLAESTALRRGSGLETWVLDSSARARPKAPPSRRSPPSWWSRSVLASRGTTRTASSRPAASSTRRPRSAPPRTPSRSRSRG